MYIRKNRQQKDTLTKDFKKSIWEGVFRAHKSRSFLRCKDSGFFIAKHNVNYVFIELRLPTTMRHNVNYVLWDITANRGKCATAQRNYTLPCLNKEFRGGGSKTVAPVFI